MFVIPRVLREREMFRSSMRSFHSLASSSRCKTWWRKGSLTEELALMEESRSSISMSLIGLGRVGLVVVLLTAGSMEGLGLGAWLGAGLIRGKENVATFSGDVFLAAASLTLMERIGFVGLVEILETTGALRGEKLGEGVLGDESESVEKERMLLSDSACVTGGCAGV